MVCGKVLQLGAPASSIAVPSSGGLPRHLPVPMSTCQGSPCFAAVPGSPAQSGHGRVRSYDRAGDLFLRVYLVVRRRSKEVVIGSRFRTRALTDRAWPSPLSLQRRRTCQYVRVKGAWPLSRPGTRPDTPRPNRVFLFWYLKTINETSATRWAPQPEGREASAITGDNLGKAHCAPVALSFMARVWVLV